MVTVLFYSKMSVISVLSDLLLYMDSNCMSILLNLVLFVEVKSQLFYDTVGTTKILTLPTSCTLYSITYSAQYCIHIAQEPEL